MCTKGEKSSSYCWARELRENLLQRLLLYIFPKIKPISNANLIKKSLNNAKAGHSHFSKKGKNSKIPEAPPGERRYLRTKFLFLTLGPEKGYYYWKLLL